MPSRIDTARLRRLIKEAGFRSFASFGASIGLSNSTMDRVLDEKNEHTYNQDTLERIAKGLNLSVYDLYKKEAINESFNVAVTEAMAEAVVEAVTEAVTVVATDVAPDASPQEVAGAIPPLPVTPPPLDLTAYLDYMRQTRSEEIDLLTRSCEQRIADCEQHNRRTRRTLYTVIGFQSAIMIYLIWEIFRLLK